MTDGVDVQGCGKYGGSGLVPPARRRECSAVQHHPLPLDTDHILNNHPCHRWAACGCTALRVAATTLCAGAAEKAEAACPINPGLLYHLRISKTVL